MEELNDLKRLKAVVKNKEKEIKRRLALEGRAKKFAAKMREIEAKDKVMFYYYRTTCQGHNGFKSSYSSDTKDYYYEFFDYLREGDDADWAQVWFDVGSNRGGREPTLQDLIDICVLFNYPFDEKLLKETYDEKKYKPEEFSCEICSQEKPCVLDEGYTFRCFKKKNTEGEWIDACNCRILICQDCCSKLHRKCPTCRETFEATSGLTEVGINRYNANMPNWKC